MYPDAFGQNATILTTTTTTTTTTANVSPYKYTTLGGEQVAFSSAYAYLIAYFSLPENTKSIYVNLRSALPEYYGVFKAETFTEILPYKKVVNITNYGSADNYTIQKYEYAKSIVDTLPPFYHTKSANLFDKNSDAIHVGDYYRSPSQPLLPGDGSYSSCAVTRIPIPEPGTYSFLLFPSSYGSDLLNCQGNFEDSQGNYLLRIIPTAKTEWTSRDKTVEGTITISENAFVEGMKLIFNFNPNYKDTLMMVKGEDYPSEYIEYLNYYTSDDFKFTTDQIIGYEKLSQKGFVRNKLYQKTIVFDGDSICHAVGDSYQDLSGKLGWAARIGYDNDMDWYNYAVGGGTLVTGLYSGTEGTTPRHWVSSYIDTIYSKHPTLDYYIVEGGTNDADLLGLDTDKYGTLDMGDYTSNTWDTDKFYNALDSIFYKATHYWPHAKVGYIVAPKMGTSSGGYTAEKSKRRFYFEMAIEVCKKWGIPYIDLWDGCSMNPRNTKHYDSSLDKQGNIDAGSLYYDGQHPTTAGYDFMTPMIESWIRSL